MSVTKYTNIVLIYSIVLMLVLYTDSAYSRNDKFERIIYQIQSSLNCKRENAIKVFNIINIFSDRVQKIISEIASSDSSRQFNEEYINKVVQQYFESENSIVQVSSRSRNSLSTYYIKEYLYHLTRLKTKYGYTKVELTFDPEYLGLSKLEKVGTNKYELSVCMWQLFSGFIDDDEIFSDATRKKFRFMFRKINNTLTVSIDQICVAETISKEKYYN